MSRSSLDLMRGTLDLLILKILSRETLHGYEIIKRIQQFTRAELHIEEGALYPALRRMEEREWLKSEWGLSSHNREVKYYRLTGEGRRQLDEQTVTWDRYVKAMDRVLRAVEGAA